MRLAPFHRVGAAWRQWHAHALAFAALGGHSVGRQLLETLVLKTLRNLGPVYYHRARFARKAVPWADKWNHATQLEYERYIDALNPPAYQKVSQHKVLEKATLTLVGIPTPRFIGFFHPQRGHDRAGQWLRTGKELQHLLAQHVGQCLCFKQVEGFGGSGFAALTVGPNAATLHQPIDGRSIKLNDWVEQLQQESDGWLIEAFLVQHPDMARFNASSVNTLRVWVLDGPNGIEVTHAIVRVGRAGDQVDNTTRGGLALPIDLAKGCTQQGPDLRNPSQWSTHHPDSGDCLVGLPIPHWAEVQQLAVQALKAVPHMRVAGLDIAIGESGPVVIELNVQPDRISALRWDLPLRPYFRRALAR